MSIRSPAGTGRLVLPRRRRAIALAAAGLAAALAGCMGIDVTGVRRADLADGIAPQSAVAFGGIRWVVDGQPLDYHLLNKPALLLFRREDGRYLNTPETDGDGRFAWTLPPGDYGIAVMFGGMPPTGQPHHMVNGHLAFVNGIVDPGLEFTVQAGRANWIGTIVVEARSKPAQALLGGRVFGALDAVRVVDDQDAQPAPRWRTDDRPVHRALARQVPRRRR